MRSALVFAVTVALTGLVLEPRARAGLSQVLGDTPRAMSLAGAYTALSNDASALYYNPAGLTEIDGSYISLAFVFSFPHFSGSDPDGRPLDLVAPRDESYGLHLGWSPTAFLGGDLGLGFSLLLPHRRALNFRVHRFDDPYFVLYENTVEVLETRFGVAYKILDRVSVGASLLLLAGVNGAVELDTPFQVRGEVDDLRRNSVAVDARITNREFFTAGVQIRASDRLTFGISYREPTFVPLRLPIDFTVQIGGLTAIRTVADLDVKVKYSPPELTFGASFRASPSLLVSIDLTSAFYAKYQVPYGNVKLDQRFNPDIVLLPPREPRTSLRNVWIPRLGLEWSPAELLVVRGGYSFFRSFIRSSDAPVLDSDKHTFALGLGYAAGAWFLPEGTALDLVAASSLMVFVHRSTAAFEHSGQVFSTTFGAEFRY